MESEDPQTNGDTATEKSPESEDSLELCSKCSNAKQRTPSPVTQPPATSPSKQTPASPSKPKDGATGTKAKRKARSTRRKLNAMVSNASLHFSDTDSEGELTTIAPPGRLSRHLSEARQGPVIEITAEDVENKPGLEQDSQTGQDADGKDTLQCNSFVESVTDVDEIYPSESETEAVESLGNLKVAENPCPGETDLEDIEGDEEVQAIIFVKPRSDIFCEYSGETITTKEGDGPFSVEIRNRMYLEEEPREQVHSNTPEITVMPNTDEEDMIASDEDLMEEACCNQKEFLDDLDVLAASQIVMKNISKADNRLALKDVSDDGASDCHTDVEDVEQAE
ncbi:uncharacterized protein LOC117220859 [Megalopta genalis]|uniref:uncharacterized protein LOC117220859 n=1 Tax=Megalopta genalis TaxID=115081 RepID=UPI003FD6A98E